MSQIPQLLEQVVEMLSRGDFDGALRLTASILEMDPRNARAHAYRAMAAFQKLTSRDLKEHLQNLGVAHTAVQQGISGRAAKQQAMGIAGIGNRVAQDTDVFVSSLGKALEVDLAMHHEFPASSAESYRHHWRDGIGKCLNTAVTLLSKLDEKQSQAMQRQVVALEKRYDELVELIASPPMNVPASAPEMTGYGDVDEDMLVAADGADDGNFPQFDLSNVGVADFAADSAELDLVGMHEGGPENDAQIPMDSGMFIRADQAAMPTMSFGADDEDEWEEEDEGPSFEELAEKQAEKQAAVIRQMFEEERARLAEEREREREQQQAQHQAQLQAAQKQLEEAQARQQAEADAAKGERKKAEKELKEAQKKMEAAQKAAEAERKKEEERIQKELARMQAERDAELARLQQEKEKEIARLQAEQEAELARLKAEREELAKQMQVAPDQVEEIAARIARQIVADHKALEASGQKAARALTPEDVQMQVARKMAEEVGTDDQQTMESMTNVIAAQGLPKDVLKDLGVKGPRTGGILGAAKLKGRKEAKKKKKAGAGKQPGGKGFTGTPLVPAPSAETMDVTSDDIHPMGTAMGAAATQAGTDVRAREIKAVSADAANRPQVTGVATKPGPAIRFTERSDAVSLDAPEGKVLLQRLRDAYTHWVNGRRGHPFPQAPSVMVPKSLRSSTVYGFQLVILFETRVLREGEATHRDEELVEAPLSASMVNPWSCQADLPFDFLQRQAVYRLPESFHVPAASGEGSKRMQFLELHLTRTPQVEMLVWPREQTPESFELLDLFADHHVTRREIFEPFLTGKDVDRLFPKALHPVLRKMAQTLRNAESDSRKIRALSVSVRQATVHRLSYTLPGSPDFSSRRKKASKESEVPQSPNHLREFTCAFVELHPDEGEPKLAVAPEVDIALDHEQSLRDEADWSSAHGRSNRTARIARELLSLNPFDKQAQKLQHLVYSRARVDYVLGFVFGIAVAATLLMLFLAPGVDGLMASAPLMLVVGSLMTFLLWHTAGVRLGSRLGRFLLSTLLVAGASVLAPLELPRLMNIEWWEPTEVFDVEKAADSNPLTGGGTGGTSEAGDATAPAPADSAADPTGDGSLGG